MIRYIVRRILIAIPLLLGITLLTFLLIQRTPGDYFETMLMDPQISPETIAHFKQLYNRDQSDFAQYISWLKNLFKGNLGYSFFYNVPVRSIIGGRLFNTFILSLSAFLVTWLIALPLGIIAAVNRNRFLDRFLSFFSFSGISIPSFFLAILLVYLASRTGILPVGGMISANIDRMSALKRMIDLGKHLIIPTLAISFGAAASLQRVMRGNMLDVLRKQYITAARARGLPEHRVIYRHALRNAINPLITIFGYSLSGLLSGAALTEIICNWPGLGTVMLTAVRAKDVYLVMASMLISGLLLLAGNLIADILLAFSDPRIRYE